MRRLIFLITLMQGNNDQPEFGRKLAITLVPLECLITV
jgi:hypothetical protein